MTFTEPEQYVRTGARRVRVERAVPMKAAAIIAALGIALIVTMGPSPASASAIVIRECGDSYAVTRYNADGSVKGVWNKQLSAQGPIYTAGQTWKLVEGDNGQPDRFVSAIGVRQVVACDAELGAGVGVRQTTPPPAPTRPVNDPPHNCNRDNPSSDGTFVHTGYYVNTGNPICEFRPHSNKLGYGYTLCSQAPTWQDAGYGLDDIDFSGHYTSSGQPICSDEDGLHSSHQYTQEQQLIQLCIREPGHALCS